MPAADFSSMLDIFSFQQLLKGPFFFSLSLFNETHFPYSSDEFIPLTGLPAWSLPDFGCGQNVNMHVDKMLSVLTRGSSVVHAIVARVARLGSEFRERISDKKSLMYN